MRIAFTANGPGEVAGWLRPLLRALYERRPDLDAIVFLVPDDYATGFEAAIDTRRVCRARVVESEEVLKFALGGAVADLPRSADAVVNISAAIFSTPRVCTRG